MGRSDPPHRTLGWPLLLNTSLQKRSPGSAKRKSVSTADERLAQGVVRRHSAVEETLKVRPSTELAHLAEFAFAKAPVPLCSIDAERRFAVVNEAMAVLLASPSAHIAGQPVASLSPQLDQAVAAAFAEAGGVCPSDARIAIRGREYRLSFNPISDQAGTIAGLSVAIEDITGHEREKQQLRRAAKHLLDVARTDYLTGLPNRSGFDIRLHQELHRCARKGSPVSLLLIDVDLFKALNDSRGHVEGDACLRATANALRRCLGRPGDSVSRYGGEEFVAILPETGTEGGATIAETCRQAIYDLKLAHPTSPYGRLTVSVGVSVLVEPPLSGEGIDVQAVKLLEAADSAMYRAEAEGRNRVAVHRNTYRLASQKYASMLASRSARRPSGKGKPLQP